MSIDTKPKAARILIVDDVAKVRSVLAQHLATEQWECVTAHNSFEALNKLKRDRYSSVNALHHGQDCYDLVCRT